MNKLEKYKSKFTEIVFVLFLFLICVNINAEKYKMKTEMQCFKQFNKICSLKQLECIKNYNLTGDDTCISKLTPADKPTIADEFLIINDQNIIKGSKEIVKFYEDKAEKYLLSINENNYLNMNCSSEGIFYKIGEFSYDNDAFKYCKKYNVNTTSVCFDLSNVIETDIGLFPSELSLIEKFENKCSEIKEEIQLKKMKDSDSTIIIVEDKKDLYPEKRFYDGYGGSFVCNETTSARSRQKCINDGNQKGFRKRQQEEIDNLNKKNNIKKCVLKVGSSYCYYE